MDKATADDVKAVRTVLVRVASNEHIAVGTIRAIKKTIRKLDSLKTLLTYDELCSYLCDIDSPVSDDVFEDHICGSAEVMLSQELRKKLGIGSI